jgi:autotransporter-associated beta strand protein
VYVTVTTPYGTSPGGLIYAQFTYALPPAVTSISPSTGPLAGGTTVIISGTNLSGTTQVYFGDVSATSVTDDGDGTFSAVSPAGDMSTVDVTVVAPGGTSATSSADQFTYVGMPNVTGISPAAGPGSGGTVVTITGTCLANATAVEFGGPYGYPGTIVSNTDGQIVVDAPQGNPATGYMGTVDIQVVTAGGTSATSSADQFSYVAAPSITGISPSWGNTSGGDIVTITGANLEDAAAVDFGASAGTVIYDSATLIEAFSPAGATGPIDVRVIAPGGTSATSPADQFTYVGAPLAKAVAYSVAQGASLTVAGPGVLAGATDPQGLPLTASLVSGPTNGTLSLGSDGSFTYTPNSGYFGQDSFTYEAGNGYLASDPALVSLTVVPAMLTWNGAGAGNWTDPQWSGANLPYPDRTVDATVDTPSVVQVTSAQTANALAISGGGQVAVAAGASLVVTTDTAVTGGGTLSVDPNGLFSSGGTVTVDTGGSLTGGPVVAAAYQLNDGTVSADLSGPGNVTKDTAGTVILSGMNSYAGPTVVDAGTLIVANAGALPDGSNLVVGAFPSGPTGGAAKTSVTAPVVLASPAANIAAASGTAPVGWALARLGTPAAAAASADSAPIAAAGALANTPVAASAVRTVSPFVQRQVENLSYGPRAASAISPAAMSRDAVDAVFASDQSAFDGAVSPVDRASSAAAWAWLANSTDQNRKAGSTVAALDMVLAQYGV